jgi:hypothetical protein
VNLLLVLPIVLPLGGTAAACMMVWRSRRAQRAIAFVTSFALLAAAIAIFVGVRRESLVMTSIGSWPAPFGIVLVADLLSALMLVVSAVIAVATAIYSEDGSDLRDFGGAQQVHRGVRNRGCRRDTNRDLNRDDRLTKRQSVPACRLGRRGRGASPSARF